MVIDYYFGEGLSRVLKVDLYLIRIFACAFALVMISGVDSVAFAQNTAEKQAYLKTCRCLGVTQGVRDFMGRRPSGNRRVHQSASSMNQLALGQMERFSLPTKEKWASRCWDSVEHMRQQMKIVFDVHKSETQQFLDRKAAEMLGNENCSDSANYFIN